ncbi:hypothetical protein GGR52DRAFT_476085 [Hypoxylon sp. FL1284]|nr:hypothetical protein GGR52DRAFT_476085 [Hypoxylon sp. FL1284]
MAVTELAWLKSTSEGVTPESKVAMESALNVQDQWCVQNAPTLPKGRENRGVGLFQQIEDPSIVLLTAHWPSVEQHTAWIESPENKTVFHALASYYELEKTVVSHINDVWIFKPADASGGVSLLESPVVSVARLPIAKENRKAFDQGWSEVKGILEDFVKPNVVNGGWRIEKDGRGTEEFVFGCGWPSVEKHREFRTTENFGNFTSVISPLAPTRGANHYRRVL